MEMVNRVAVIIRPKPAFVDWLNAHPVLEFNETDQLALDYLQKDCTVLLVPAEFSLEGALEWLADFKIAVLELELEGWLTQPEDWPAERTPELFDEWFALEAHSMIYDLADEEPWWVEDAWESEDDDWEGEEDAWDPEDDETAWMAGGQQAWLRDFTHQLAQDLWQRGRAGEALEGEEQRLYQAMRKHREYHQVWERIDRLADAPLEVEGVNPLLHITLHSTIAGQLEAQDPPEVEATLRALLRQGKTRHEAEHMIMSVLVDEIYRMLTEQEMFDEETYQRNLKQLARSG